MARSVSIRWRVPPSVIAQGIDKSAIRFRQVLTDNLQQAAALGTTYGQQNHPWQNQSGQAEATFKVEVTEDGLGLRVSHGVFYGVYLEYKNGGQYAVIPIVMQYMGPVVKDAMQDALNAAGFG